jgi:uncharacterized membrane protein YhhN
MTFDIGLGGIGMLALISLAFGIGAQVLLGRGHTRWMWLIGAVAWFVGGLAASEVVWGTLTETEIQPIVDGLALDEALLGGVIAGVTAVTITWFATRRRHLHGPGPMAS